MTPNEFQLIERLSWNVADVAKELKRMNDIRETELRLAGKIP